MRRWIWGGSRRGKGRIADGWEKGQAFEGFSPRSRCCRHEKCGIAYVNDLMASEVLLV